MAQKVLRPVARVTGAAFVEVQLYAVGTILAGKYRVIRELGRGGMGAVIEAHHMQLDERVALKFLLPEFITRPEFVERFLREARAAVRIKSEHIARVSDVGTLENGAPYMVMEFLEGRDLASQHAHFGAFALEEAVDFGLQAGVALAEAHGLGIVHRDIKPANLFLSRASDGAPLIKLLDFGISKMADSDKPDGLTKTSTTMGSVLYMSPEQMKQTKSVDHRADIYSLGISLYELLGGRQPFHAETMPELYVLILTGTPTPLRDLRPDLPEAFARVLEKSYARLPEDRYASMADFARALAPFAPARSRTSLERIERLAQAQRTRGSLPSNTGPVMQPKAMTDHGFAPPPTNHGFAPPPTNNGFAPPPTANLPSQPAGHTVAGAPLPHGAAAITGSTNTNLSTTTHSKSSRTPLLLGLLAAGLAGALGAVLFFGGFLGKKAPSGASASPAVTESVAPTSQPTTQAAASTTAVATSATPEPSASTTAPAPSASASSVASVSSTPSASPTVATKPTGPRPTARPTVTVPVLTAPPPPPPSTGNVFKDR